MVLSKSKGRVTFSERLNLARRIQVYLEIVGIRLNPSYWPVTGNMTWSGSCIDSGDAGDTAQGGVGRR